MTENLKNNLTEENFVYYFEKLFGEHVKMTEEVRNEVREVYKKYYGKEVKKMKDKLPKKVIKDEPLRKASEEDRARLARTRAKPDNDELLRDEADSVDMREPCKDCIHYVACKNFHKSNCMFFEDKKTYLKIPESLIQREGYPVKVNCIETRITHTLENEYFYKKYPYEVRAHINLGVMFLKHSKEEAEEQVRMIENGEINRFLGAKTFERVERLDLEIERLHERGRSDDL